MCFLGRLGGERAADSLAQTPDSGRAVPEGNRTGRVEDISCYLKKYIHTYI